MLRFRGWLFAALAAAPCTAALAQNAKPTEIPCEQARLVFALDNAKCQQYPDVMPRDSNKIASIPTRGVITLVANGPTFRVSIAGNIPDRANISVSSGSESGFPDRAARFNSWSRSGSEWSGLKAIANAWAASFKSGGERCVYFENFGPYHNQGYKWSIWGVVCDLDKARAGTAFADADIQRLLSLVLPK